MASKKFSFSGTCLIVSFIFLRTLAQVLFKQIALGPGGSNYMKLILDPLFYLTGIIFLVQAVVWLLVLKRMPLSVAYPFTSVAVITLLISGALFFGEVITLGNILGSILIMVGIIVIAGAKKDNKKTVYRFKS